MLYALFETERYLFQVWGKRVGIEKQSDFHRCLDPTSPEYPSVRGILQGLETILSNGDGVCKKYGLVSKEYISTRWKYLWAVSDKKKFDRVVKDIGTLVEKLSTVASLKEDTRFDTDQINHSLATLTAALDGIYVLYPTSADELWLIWCRSGSQKGGRKNGAAETLLEG